MDDATDVLNFEVWRACAGLTVRIPPIHSRVYYFPQGHVEYASSPPAFSDSPPVLCRLDSSRFCANRDTDEVFVVFCLTPISPPVRTSFGFSPASGADSAEDSPTAASYSKVLTQSDANNGGGFSVPRLCADSIFPPLDFNADPPVQTITVRDVHGSSWSFRHIYRGTPRRHLLTTGWSKFVNNKMLVAGDSIVFIKTGSGEIFVGVRRSTGGTSCGEAVPRWNTPLNDCLGSPNETEQSSMGGQGFCRRRGRVPAAAVQEALARAVAGHSFEVVYYPKAGMPEFCVAVEAVDESMKVMWAAGMRVRMKLETEDSSMSKWCTGTVAGVDPVSRPISHWRMLQVTWDEPEILPNAKSVSPWEVEIVSTMPQITLPVFSLESSAVGRESVGTSCPPIAGFHPIMGSLLPPVMNYNNRPVSMMETRRDMAFETTLHNFSSLVERHHRSFSNGHFMDTDALFNCNYGSVDQSLNACKFLQSQQASPESCSRAQNLKTHNPENQERTSPKTPTSITLFGKPIWIEQNNFASEDNESGHVNQFFESGANSTAS